MKATLDGDSCSVGVRLFDMRRVAGPLSFIANLFEQRLQLQHQLQQE